MIVLLLVFGPALVGQGLGGLVDRPRPVQRRSVADRALVGAE